MATSQTGQVLHHLRRAVLADGAGPTDGQLLEGFVGRRDEAAFEALDEARFYFSLCKLHGPIALCTARGTSSSRARLLVFVSRFLPFRA
jgi:hypothetical protein